MSVMLEKPVAETAEERIVNPVEKDLTSLPPVAPLFAVIAPGRRKSGKMGVIPGTPPPIGASAL